MAGRGTRRQFLAGTAGAVTAALAAACSGPSGESFAPARTPAPPATETYVPPTLSTGLQPTSGPIFGTVLPTPKRGAPAPDFVRMLSFVPDDPALHGNTVTFSNPGELRRLYAYDQVRGPADLQAQNIPAADYANVLSGCALSDFAGGLGAPGKWRDAFGYDSFSVDREIWAGQLPNAFSRLEGPFDADTITMRLQMGGYTATETPSGISYATVRGDNEEDLRDARSQLALGRMNRIAVAKDRLVASPKTAFIEAALNAEARKAPALDANLTFRPLADALPTVTSLSTAPPAALVPVAATVPPDALARFTRGFVPLHPAELYAAGYTDNGTYQRTMHLALVYANAGDAAADAPEIQRRVTGFRLLGGEQPLIPMYATGATTRTLTAGSKGLVIVDIALLPAPPLSRFWLDTWRRGEIFLLLMPTVPGSGATVPATGNASAAAPAASTAITAGTPRPTGAIGSVMAGTPAASRPSATPTR